MRNLNSFLTLIFVLFFFNIGAAQKSIKVFAQPFYTSVRIPVIDPKDISNDEHFLMEFSEKNFFDSIQVLCLVAGEITGEALKMLTDTNLFVVNVLIKARKNEFIVSNSGYVKLNNKMYPMNCEIYSYYIKFIQLRYALWLTPNTAMTLDCPFAKSLIYLHPIYPFRR